MIEILFFVLIIFSLVSIIKPSKTVQKVIQLSYAFLLFGLNLSIYLFDLKASYLLQEYFFFDLINKILLFVMSIIFLGIIIHQTQDSCDETIKPKTEYTACLLAFVFSMTGALLSRHLAMLWVFIEATTLSSTFLIWYDRSKRSLEAAWKYLFICSIGIALAFVGIILLSMGTSSHHSLFFEDLWANAALYSPFWLKISFIFMLVGFGTKMGLAPMHTWKADTYSQAPTHISALLASVLFNVAMIPVFRIFKMMKLAGLETYASNILMITGFMSLIFSAYYMIKVKNYKRMLAYSSIENAGIIMIALSLGGFGTIAAVIHIISHSFTKAFLFLVAGNIERLYKTPVISEVKGLISKSSFIGTMWIVGFLAIACLPPFLSFISEFNLMKAFVFKAYYLQLTAFLVLTTIIIFQMGKAIFMMSFASTEKGQLKIYTLKRLSVIVLIVFISIVLIGGLYIPDYIYEKIKQCSLEISADLICSERSECESKMVLHCHCDELAKKQSLCHLSYCPQVPSHFVIRDSSPKTIYRLRG